MPHRHTVLSQHCWLIFKELIIKDTTFFERHTCVPYGKAPAWEVRLLYKLPSVISNTHLSLWINHLHQVTTKYIRQNPEIGIWLTPCPGHCTSDRGKELVVDITDHVISLEDRSRYTVRWTRLIYEWMSLFEPQKKRMDLIKRKLMDTDQSMQLKSLCLKIYQYMYYPLSLIHMNRSRSQINWVKLSVNNSNCPGSVKIPRSRVWIWTIWDSPKSAQMDIAMV